MPLYLDLSRKTCRRSDLNQRSLALSGGGSVGQVSTSRDRMNYTQTKFEKRADAAKSCNQIGFPFML